jgi:pyruvate formate lyase activating enzyme
MTNLTRGIIFDIKRFAIHDGPGIRATVFFKGCPMDCHWCHNPESRLQDPQETDKGEMIGREVTVEEVMREIEKEVLFFDESGGGVTFSGGEPLMQPEFLEALLDRCRALDIHTTLDTTGFAEPVLFNKVMDKVDLFLYDLKLMDENIHCTYSGVSNIFVKANLKTAALKRKKVVIRFPVIPGITDTEENIKGIGEFAASLKTVKRIDLLAYHRTAEAKYRRLNMEYRAADIEPPSEAHMDRVEALFRQYARHVEIIRE